MSRSRFVPLNVQIGGYFKTFFIIWVISFIILLIALGLNTWAFWGAIPISFLVAVPIYYVLVIMTGVKGGIT